MTRLQKQTHQGDSPSKQPDGGGNYVLRLFVTGNTPRSVRSILNIKSFCQRFLKDRYELEIVDIYQQPALARTEQIIAAPTLIKRLPPPFRTLVGDFSDQERVAAGLNVTIS